ncbi:hypothetical protein KC853_02960 [Candidatus Saccharibacteria bacterium]|nr:hypothetical protein [Candidatus Saccharibacteria bacterium]MCB9834952.1 hypothetical protein [Candidatus Nomurabacteria bacterium]
MKSIKASYDRMVKTLRFSWLPILVITFISYLANGDTSVGIINLYLVFSVSWLTLNIDSIQSSDKWSQAMRRANTTLLSYIAAMIISIIISLPWLYLVIFSSLIATQVGNSILLLILGVVIILIGIYILIRFSLAFVLILKLDLPIFKALNQSWSLLAGKKILKAIPYYLIVSLIGLLILVPFLIFPSLGLFLTTLATAVIAILLTETSYQIYCKVSPKKLK